MLQHREQPVPQSLRALMTGLVDYAGLFPPAGLDMTAAVRNYARYLAGEHAWMLARFVVPAARLAEFERAQAGVTVAREWKLSALLDANAGADIEAVAEFNLRNSGRARVDALEMKAGSVEEIHRVGVIAPAETQAYFEISSEHTTELLDAVRDVGGRAKIRTGGVTPNAIPSVQAVARFIDECARVGVAFKATAGLHHPLRCTKALTYEANAPRAAMHGFLNVFLVAALRFGQLKDAVDTRGFVLTAFLGSAAPQLEFTESAVKMGTARHDERMGTMATEAVIPTAQILAAREHFAVSFGSCSFEEPVSEMQELTLL